MIIDLSRTCACNFPAIGRDDIIHRPVARIDAQFLVGIHHRLKQALIEIGLASASKRMIFMEYKLVKKLVAVQKNRSAADFAAEHRDIMFPAISQVNFLL
jgi:hypothetical protein